MPGRMLQTLGPLLAVAAIAVVPSAASSATRSTATASGGSGGGCYDHNPPSSNWGHGWWHNNGNGPYWHGWGDGNGYFGGGSRDNGCDALHPGKVATVKVAVAKMGDGKCQHLLGHGGRLSRPSSCGVRHWLTATGTRTWRYDINRRLPHGRYRLHRRAVDSSGNHEAPDMWHVRIR
jgi:hypothetical protein